jgi:hypothetical protein
LLLYLNLVTIAAAAALIAVAVAINLIASRRPPTESPDPLHPDTPGTAGIS